MSNLKILKIGAKALVYDFAEKVAPIYKQLNWEWFDGIPDEDKIVEMLNHLIDGLRKKDRSLSSGGLCVKKCFDGKKVIGVTLEMEISTTAWLDQLKKAKA
jgi:hypothetical protein